MNVIIWVTKAQQNITKNIIVKCFAKVGFLVSNGEIDIVNKEMFLNDLLKSVQADMTKKKLPILSISEQERNKLSNVLSIDLDKEETEENNGGNKCILDPENLLSAESG